MSTIEFTARHRFAGITARKARRIAELLQFAPQRGAAFYLKVVRSAVANASQDENVNINRLVISDCRADDGPLLSGRMRFRPGPQGRAMPFAKRLSHLTVKVTPLDDAVADDTTDATADEKSATKSTKKKSSPSRAGAKSVSPRAGAQSVSPRAGAQSASKGEAKPASSDKPARKKSAKKKQGEGEQA
jgi:large subunit ribosomal protein L22